MLRVASLPDRPRVLTDAVQAEIVRYVAEGNYFEVACRAAGVSRDTVDYWRKLYEAGAEHAQVYADFFGALARAQAIAEVQAVRCVRSGRFGWQGDAWFLDRRFRARWNAKQKGPDEEEEESPATDEHGDPIEP